MAEDKNTEVSWTYFLDIVKRLRGEGGCPWDKEQTYESLTKYVLEEAYELVYAATSGEPNKLKEELGDLLLEVGLYCQIASEKGDFSPSDVLKGISDKLIRRHPHIFGEESLTTKEQVRERWDEIKRQEVGRYEKGHSLMDEVQKGLPALMTARRQGELAASVGFDWDSPEPIFRKVKEELGELKEACAMKDERAIDEEAGDLLLSCVNLLRHLGVEPETVLLSAVDKFSNRFRLMEESFKEREQKMGDQDPCSLNELWERAKMKDDRKRPGGI